MVQAKVSLYEQHGTAPHGSALPGAGGDGSRRDVEDDVPRPEPDTLESEASGSMEMDIG